MCSSDLTAVKEYVATVVGGLETLSRMVLGDLSKQLRVKVKTIITIEVHARDVVLRFIDNRIESSQDFAWQSQLKYRWDEEQKDCFINISDAEFRYSYEYTGNCGRLVITALYDLSLVSELVEAQDLGTGGLNSPLHLRGELQVVPLPVVLEEVERLREGGRIHRERRVITRPDGHGLAPLHLALVNDLAALDDAYPENFGAFFAPMLRKSPLKTSK